MRIRSIKPEFWKSEDIAALDWDARLVFIGLWSYVDDNGVGRDVEKLIAADLFALEDDPRETLARVSRALATLSGNGLVYRYTVAQRRFLHICSWDRHQRVDRPGKGRYPLPTCDDAEFATLSRDTRETLATGEGEKGRRGEGEKTNTRSPAAHNAPTDDAVDASAFEAFWTAYPRKVGKQAAHRAWTRATRTTQPTTITQAAARLAADPNLPETQFIPHPATWLNRGGWQDEPHPPREPQPTRMSPGDRALMLAAQYAQADTKPDTRPDFDVIHGELA